MALMNNTTTNAGEDAWGGGNPYSLLVGMQISATPIESIMEFSQKTKNRTTI
jgi:hypothetical protein